MRDARGYAVWSLADGRKIERDTLNCAHCGSLIFLDPARKADSGGFCRLCMKATCGPCTDAGACTPFERRLTEIEHRAYVRRSYGES